MTIEIEPTKGTSKNRVCTLRMGVAQYRGILLDLPRHVEAYKTLDSEQYYKTNDIGQILLVVEKESDLDVYKANDYFPHGLTPPMVDAYETLKISEESLRKVPKEDVSAIESIIYNEKTDEFTYEEVIEEEPHMAAWRSAKEKDRRKIVSV